MKCPKCGKEMKVIRKDNSFNNDNNNKKYDRTVYHCEKDDVWMNLEIPEI